VDGARIWISGTAERNDDDCDSDITCPDGYISLFAGNQLFSLFSALYACPSLSWLVIFEATELISIIFVLVVRTEIGASFILVRFEPQHAILYMKHELWCVSFRPRSHSRLNVYLMVCSALSIFIVTPKKIVSGFLQNCTISSSAVCLFSINGREKIVSGFQ
jgi:hypothetical protein